MSNVASSERLSVVPFFDRASCTYTYLLLDPATRQGALIDPVTEQFERDMQMIEELGVELHFVIETHAHADHITSAGMMRQRTGAKIVFGAAAGVDGVDIALEDGDTFDIGGFTVTALATPGHTSGCTSYVVDGNVFTGDALLIRGCGRTDFQQGNAAQLYDSITQKLFTLPDDTRVFPGHDYQGRTVSTIGDEKQWNPRIGGGKTQAQFVDIMSNLNLATPKRINEAVPANMECAVKYHPGEFLHEEFSMSDLHKVWLARREQALIVDVRSAEEFAQSHVPGAVNIPLGREAEAAEMLDSKTEVYLYCRTGRRAQTALTNLALHGISHVRCVADTGMPDWLAAGYPVE